MRRTLREESKGFNNRTLEIQWIQKRKTGHRVKGSCPCEAHVGEGDKTSIPKI